MKAKQHKKSLATGVARHFEKIENEQIPYERNYLMETTKYFEMLQKASLSLMFSTLEPSLVSVMV